MNQTVVMKIQHQPVQDAAGRSDKDAAFAGKDNAAADDV
jgi:hypothetical protein